ncbi:hypothetical protein COLO4_28815 [Corchorus olitorius]|uniref:Uncharacterized protein n=1 Tax=Corchorus olitorius TaxID=93759 RepID=A0A1R3HI49_9ROSI|nr:hypothetical protein COLO4_28815 [Corchorus olitorius]
MAMVGLEGQLELHQRLPTPWKPEKVTKAQRPKGYFQDQMTKVGSEPNKRWKETQS